MRLIQTLLVAAFGIAIYAPAFGIDDGWIQDFTKAMQQASEEGKDLLLNFTKPHCPPCNFTIPRPG
jgi:thioredoxin-related protein